MTCLLEEPPGRKAQADMTDLSVVIVNWNTKDLLRECLKSILETKADLNIEIYVVDNASSDSSAEMVEKEFPHVGLIRNQVNLGFGKANNQAISKSSGRNILLLNPDSVVKPQALRSMVDFLDSQKDIGALGARLINSDGSLQYSIRRFPTILTPFTENLRINRLFPIRSYYDRYRLKNWDHSGVREVDQPMGAAFLVKKQVLETLGGFDEIFHMFFEDVDLCWRIKQNGWKIVYYPDAVIVHYGGRSVRKRDNISEEFYQSLLKYFHKNHSIFYFMGVRTFMVFGSILNIVSALVWAPFSLRNSMEIVSASYKVLRAGIKRNRRPNKQ